MFANAEGASQRAPVNWSESVIGAAVCFPYVVALDESFITIHSMLDQQLKQTLSFRDGHILQDFEGAQISSFWLLNVVKRSKHLLNSAVLSCYVVFQRHLTSFELHVQYNCCFKVFILLCL